MGRAGAAVYTVLGTCETPLKPTIQIRLQEHLAAGKTDPGAAGGGVRFEEIAPSR